MGRVAQVTGGMGGRGQTGHAAAKAGMHGVTGSPARELATFGATDNTISPSCIGTKMVLDIPQGVLETRILPQIPAGCLGKLQEVAGRLASLRPEVAAFVIGANISINVGQHRP